MRRRPLLPVVLLAAGLALAGCAAVPADPPPGADPAPTASPSAAAAAPAEDPAGLVGLWRVTGAAGESADTWLRLAVSDLGYADMVLWRDCGVSFGEWDASSTLFVASVSGWGMPGCQGTSTVPDPVPWLESATGYRPAGPRIWQLVDASGAVLATLAEDGTPPHSDTVTDDYLQPPLVTESARAALAEPAPLPAGATPAADLAGRWVSGLPVAPSAGTELAEPFVEVAADGTWTGSDGCNGAAGAWRLGPGGRLLATIGSTTAMACEGAALPYSLAGASRASVDGSTLTVFDSAGSVLGTLTRG